LGSAVGAVADEAINPNAAAAAAGGAPRRSLLQLQARRPP
jgi:hypothetical protein